MQDIFYRSGKVVYKFRWLIIAFTLITLLSTIPILPSVMKPFNSTGFFNEHSESAKANEFLNKQLGYSYNRFIIIYNHPTLLTTDPKFTREIKDSLANLIQFKGKHQVLYPDEIHQISKDNHTAYAVVMFESNQEVGHQFLTEFKSLLKKPANLEMRIGGEPIFLDEVAKQTQMDLGKAEYIGTPAAIITLLIIFGSVVAAVLPILLGAYCATIIVTSLYFLANLFSLSIFTINIALLVGLCLSLDYSLFFISRFRNQIAIGQSAKEAVAVTLSTAGKAIFFSGIAVFISMSALLLFPINILFSVGVGGLTSVLIAMFVALVILPALLSVLNTRINALSIRWFKFKEKNHWQRFIGLVVKKPLIFFSFVMIALLTLSYPCLNIEFGVSNFKILPKESESRQFYTIFSRAFNENELSPITIIVSSPEDILSKNNIGYIYDLTQSLQKDKRIDKVNSIVNLAPDLSKQIYQDIYKTPTKNFDPRLENYLKTNTTSHFTVITAVSKTPDSSEETKALIRDIRNQTVGNGMTLQVTGPPANTYDVLEGIAKILPYAFTWIILFSYLILLVLLRSVVLPLKAILTTILSLMASYGVLVFVIQQGHFHEILHFETQGMLDISLCIIIVCALFGFSMDYEVFLLARIKECYEKSGDTMKSIIQGIDQSSRIITSAAIIVILICYSFMSANILIVKAFGLGIAAAIIVDAFLIRFMLVPAVMALLGKWNWYLPNWIRVILPKVFFDHG